MGAKGKRMQAALQQIDKDKHYSVSEIVKVLKKNATAKFDETIEISVNLGIDPRHSDQTVRGTVTLPSGTGKSVRVAVFAKGEKAEDARKAGADIVGDEDLAETVQKGELNFDRCIATPDMMAIVGRLGQILGPKGMMPNPKLGTVTTDVGQAVKIAKAGQIEFRNEKLGIVHAAIGKASFSEDSLIQNINAIIAALKQAKPEGSKGTYMKKVKLCTTMGPSCNLDLEDI
tara:strand:+ start:560 stop:1249 length:690 start_codon:yes stop_codon:yes gene_type:complete